MRYEAGLLRFKVWRFGLQASNPLKHETHTTYTPCTQFEVSGDMGILSPCNEDPTLNTQH